MAMLDAAGIKALYAEAQKLQGAGQSEEALRAYGRIVETNPNIAEVHYQIVRIYTDAGLAAKALPHGVAATTLKPAEPAVWLARADAVALAGDDDAETQLLSDLKVAPIAPALRIALQDRFGANRMGGKVEAGGVKPAQMKALGVLMARRDFARAERDAAALLKAHPQSPAMANVLGAAQAAQGKFDAAAASFQRTIQLSPFLAEAHNNFGQARFEQRQPAVALPAFRRAVALAPSYPSGLANLASCLANMGDARQALPFAKRAVAADPNFLPAQLALGNAYLRLRSYNMAEEALQKALKLANGKSPEALAQLAQVQARLGNDDTALKNYDLALELAPNLPAALGGKASLLQTFGRFDEAEPLFRRVFELDPLNGENYRLFIASHKTKADDPVIAAMAAHYDHPMLAETDRMNIGFALAKAYEDVKEYGKVFRYLDVANTLMRKSYPYSMATRYTEMDAITRAYDGFDWHGTRIAGASDFAPIFVTGMPRSGTTLVEQIIASHSTVTGAGEVGEGSRRALELVAPGGVYRAMADVPHADLAEMGTAYAAYMRERWGGTPRVTDKSIQTYMYLGLTRLALPNARFIVVRRDPRDNLLSIYKNKFPDGTHLYAYDQQDLAAYYQTFVDMIDFWRERVPDWFYEVQYEELVANPETEARKLIAACGLEWEDQCLKFHENKRKVETLSIYQVRQPISGGSVKAWQRYGDALNPMLDALKELGHGTD